MYTNGIKDIEDVDPEKTVAGSYIVGLLIFKTCLSETSEE